MRGEQFTQEKSKHFCLLFSVRLKGLEPPRLAAPDPKSGMSTNSITAAKFGKQRYYFLTFFHKSKTEDY